MALRAEGSVGRRQKKAEAKSDHAGALRYLLLSLVLGYEVTRLSVGWAAGLLGCRRGGLRPRSDGNLCLSLSGMLQLEPLRRAGRERKDCSVAVWSCPSVTATMVLPAERVQGFQKEALRWHVTRYLKLGTGTHKAEPNHR